jgi:outer membrane protein OmpA-like peptidoglycan-associated protein
MTTMANYRFALWMATAALAVTGATGCASKNWVKSQTAPINDHTAKLEDQTAANGRAIKDTDERAQAGISKAQSAADAAASNAQNATKSAGDAETAANDAVHRADSLAAVVKGLDNYKPIADVTVNFGFDKAVLTSDDKDQLDSFASKLGSEKSYILEVTGGTDSTGSAQYNYDLSQRRADAVVQYLASKYNIPPHRFYLIGIGKDEAVASNDTKDGRKANRRVQVQLLTNMKSDQAPAAAPGTGR